MLWHCSNGKQFSFERDPGGLGSDLGEWSLSSSQRVAPAGQTPVLGSICCSHVYHLAFFLLLPLFFTTKSSWYLHLALNTKMQRGEPIYMLCMCSRAPYKYMCSYLDESMGPYEKLQTGVFFPHINIHISRVATTIVILGDPAYYLLV